jgi:transposase
MFFEEMCKVMEDLWEESFAEGRRKQAQMTARNLSVQGLSAEQIAQAVGFSVETVEEWLAQKNV